MREIKFRAWDKDLKEMIMEGIVLVNGKPIANKIDRSKPLSEQEQGIIYPNWVLMQFTGLKDKNGVEIYEGDIIFIPSWKLVGKNPHSIVKWDNSFKIMLEQDNDYFEIVSTHIIEGRNVKIPLAECLIFHKECEVVGNVFENKELLEEKNGEGVKDVGKKSSHNIGLRTRKKDGGSK